MANGTIWLPPLHHICAAICKIILKSVWIKCRLALSLASFRISSRTVPPLTVSHLNIQWILSTALVAAAISLISAPSIPAIPSPHRTSSTRHAFLVVPPARPSGRCIAQPRLHPHPSTWRPIFLFLLRFLVRVCCMALLPEKVRLVPAGRHYGPAMGHLIHLHGPRFLSHLRTYGLPVYAFSVLRRLSHPMSAQPLFHHCSLWPAANRSGLVDDSPVMAGHRRHNSPVLRPVTPGGTPHAACLFVGFL